MISAPSTHRPRRSPALSLAATLLLVCAAAAQDKPSLIATVEPAEIRPGSFSTYTITIENGRPDAASALTLPDAVEQATASPSFSQQTTILNGVVKNQLSLSWQVTAREIGEHTIPAQELHVGGIPFKSNAVKLVVKDNPSSPASQYDPIMTLETSRREFYVGEVVPIQAVLYIHRRTLLRRVGLIELPKDNFAIQRFPMQADENIVTMAGVPYRELTFQSTLSGLKPGTFTLGPATSEIILEVPSEDGRLQHPFFSQSEPRKVIPACNEIEVTVLPLPEKDRPPGFSGVVGDFEISATAEPGEVSVGEPASVELTLTGTGNFDAIKMPELQDSGSWKTYPARRFDLEIDPAGSEQQSLTFNQVVIPQKARVQPPSFEFSYFSPTQKKYVTLRTPPLKLKVRSDPDAVEPPPASAAQDAAPASSDPEKTPQARPNITDILVTNPGQPAWLKSTPPLWEQSGFLLANYAAGGALLIMILAKLGVVLHHHSLASPDAPVKKIWQSLHKSHLHAGDFYAHAAAYIAAKNLHSPAIQDLLDKHHRLNYGPGHADAAIQISATERAHVLAVLKEAASTPA